MKIMQDELNANISMLVWFVMSEYIGNHDNSVFIILYLDCIKCTCIAIEIKPLLILQLCLK